MLWVTGIINILFLLMRGSTLYAESDVSTKVDIFKFEFFFSIPLEA